MKEKEKGKKGKRSSLSEEELRKRLIVDTFADPGGLDTSLTFVDQPIIPMGTNLGEKRDEKK
ncbi:MAG: hypothetical protein GX493_05360 [Firmicutes bacterium]|nr:hypothetical protein [Bacillota bacterium]